MPAKPKSGSRSTSKRGAGAATPLRKSTSPQVELRRVSKGKRPQFHDSEAVDQLFAVVTALTAELSVAFDRIDTVERILVAAGTFTEERVETYQPSRAVAEERSARRESLIERVFAVFEAYGAPKPS